MAVVTTAAIRSEPSPRSVALVTGASSGIGAALAEALAAEGYAVALAARSKQRLDEVALCVRNAGGQALAIVCDVADPLAVQRLVDEVAGTWGRLDVVIANAGAYQRKPATEITRTELEAAFAVNFWGSFHLVDAVLPRLLSQRSGHVVLMTSFDAKKGMPHDGAYAAAKAATAAYAGALRQAVRDRGVHVCTVFPGRVDTPMIEDLEVPGISAKIPAARVAKAVMRALRRRSPEVVVPWHCRLLLWADTVSPRLGDWLVRTLRLDGRRRSP
ncbi:MAG: SDR family oxidoreductase [Planctomycetota bacterium]